MTDTFIQMRTEYISACGPQRSVASSVRRGMGQVTENLCFFTLIYYEIEKSSELTLHCFIHRMKLEMILHRVVMVEFVISQQEKCNIRIQVI